MRLLLLTLFAPSTADFAWESSAPAYHATAALADSEDSASCCGCERVSDPAYGEDGLSCPCDATAGACDAGCCCDTSDCTASELVDVFGCPSAGAPGGAGRAGVTYCSDLLARANIPQTAAARGWSDVTDLDGLLCVQTDNSESRGAFLSDPFPTCSALSSQDESDVLDHLRAEENVGNLTAFRQWLAPAAAAVSGDSRYTLGAPVLGDGCVDAVDDAGCSRRAPLLLPARGPSGACEGSQLVPYLTDTAPYACNTPAALPIAELCAGWLNATVLLRQKVASSPVSSDAALALSYLLYNTTTGAYDAVDAPPAAFLTSDRDCFSALTSLEYRLTVSAEGKITAAAAYLVTEDVSSASAAAGVAQSLALGFEHQDAPVTSRPISGRPGYVRGRPVLIADSFGGAFALRTDALQLLPRGARGQCSTDGPATPLSFGDDLALSCVTELDAVQLEDGCVDVATPGALPALAPLNLSWSTEGALAYVGAFGDAHPAVGDHWVPLKLASGGASVAPSWDAQNGICKNMLKAVFLRFVAVDYSATVDPVRRIVYAELAIEAQDVGLPRCALGRGGPDCKAYVTTSISSSFVVLPPTWPSGRVFDYVPPNPTLIPPLPTDIFFPFEFQDTTAGTTFAARRRLAGGEREDSQPSTSAGARALAASLVVAAVLVALAHAGGKAA